MLVSREDPGISSIEGPFTFGQRLGIVFIVEAAFLSLFSVLGLLLYITFAARRTRRYQRWSSSTPLHVYFLSMMISEMIQSTGVIMNLRWVTKANVSSGVYCSAQGAIKQIGDIAVALNTLAIALHTFSAIVFRWRPRHPKLVSCLVMSFIWLTIASIIIISIGTHKDNLQEYWGDTAFWCWITKRYHLQQYLLDYLFMWLTAFANIILYVPLCLVLKGIISVNGLHVKYRRKENRQHITTQGSHTSGKGVDSIAMQMLFYPAIYTLTVLPIAVVRFRAFNDKHVPFTYTVIADVLFALSGFFNVILFGFTRPALLPRRESTLPPSHHTNVSFSLRSPMADQFSVRTPAADQHSFYLRSPTTADHHSLSCRPSLPPPARTQIGALPDDSEIYRFDSNSFTDALSMESPTKPGISPSLSSIHSINHN
ncbi:hypothetical protein PNOK_0195600 [Pyrrhoderma noxium]|uniref:G-protein coupled receptors family 1 profile domain-containing protein n=1 Tax=Pyrrhoderma noxium TaxID=2282107 RepID=A0A286UR29_9AGAM|nr:hypothetical protein PNOK_0195600 [Pyrrhoderma noxium]